MLVSEYFVGGKGKAVARVQRDAAVAKASYAVFGTLGVKHYRHGQAQLRAGFLYRVHHFFMVGVLAVREIEACNVHSREYHFFQYIDRRTCRSYGAYDLGFFHYRHIPLSPLFFMPHAVFDTYTCVCDNFLRINDTTKSLPCQPWRSVFYYLRHFDGAGLCKMNEARCKYAPLAVTQ